MSRKCSVVRKVTTACAGAPRIKFDDHFALVEAYFTISEEYIEKVVRDAIAKTVRSG